MIIGLCMRKIMIIDDQRDVLSFLEKTFLGEGFDVITLSYIPRREDVYQIAPDVVIIDLLMPGTTGYAFGKELVEQRNGKLPLVLLISGRNEDILRHKSEEIGADGWISKPFYADDILDLVRSLLEKSLS